VRQDELTNRSPNSAALFPPPNSIAKSQTILHKLLAVSRKCRSRCRLPLFLVDSQSRSDGGVTTVYLHDVQFAVKLPPTVS
jgi:hypothetical protein